MPILFAGEIHVHYGQFYVESRTDEFFEALTESRGGQTNGLCGAAVPGLLYLTTGLHTGTVELTVEVFDAVPPIGDEWEEVVEASFRPETEEVQLVQWAGEASWPLALRQIDYRVRYCATGMDAGRRRDTRMDEEPVLDRYLLQFWPDRFGPDEVVRQRSEIAAYWHAHARTLQPPPTPEQRAAAKRQERLARQRANEQAALEAETRRWGGRLPSERARRTNGAFKMAGLNRDLFDRIEQLDAAGQRAIARWAAHRAYSAAGLTELDWVAPALAALDRGEPLPPPFDDHTHAFERLSSDPHVQFTVVASYDGRYDRISQQHAAVPALFAAASDDPLRAALESLFHAVVTFGSGYDQLLAEVPAE